MPDLRGGSDWSRGFASFSACSLRNPGLRECGCVSKGPGAELPSQLGPRATLQPAPACTGGSTCPGVKAAAFHPVRYSTRQRATWYHQWPQEGARFPYYFRNGICEITIRHVHSQVTILTLKTSAYSLTMSPFNKEDNLSSHLRSLGQCVATPADASERDGLKPTGKNEKSMWQPCLLAH